MERSGGKKSSICRIFDSLIQSHELKRAEVLSSLPPPAAGLALSPSVLVFHALSTVHAYFMYF